MRIDSTLFPLCLPFLLAGCAAAPSDAAPSLDGVGSSRQAILGGKDDVDHRETVAVLRLDESMQWYEQACSGVLVAPRIVVTAAHCVGTVSGSALGATCEAIGATPAPTVTSVAAANRITVATGSIIYNATSFVAESSVEVKGVSLPPGASDTALCGNDIAVLELADPITDATPATVRTSKAVVVGEEVQLVGYGKDGTKAGSDGQRRSLDGSKVEAVGETKRPSGGIKSMATEWIVDRGPCDGDSGSPAFDASGAVVGIMSRGTKATCTQMTYARVDAGGHADWLTKIVGEISTKTGDPLPEWALPKAIAAPANDEEANGPTSAAPAPAPAPEGSAENSCQASPIGTRPSPVGLLALLLLGCAGLQRSYAARRRGST